MEKIIGKFKSEQSGIIYTIWWYPNEKTVWRDTQFEAAREMIGYNASDESSAINAAKSYLSLQI